MLVSTDDLLDLPDLEDWDGEKLYVPPLDIITHTLNGTLVKLVNYTSVLVRINEMYNATHSTDWDMLGFPSEHEDEIRRDELKRKYRKKKERQKQKLWGGNPEVEVVDEWKVSPSDWPADWIKHPFFRISRAANGHFRLMLRCHVNTDIIPYNYDNRLHFRSADEAKAYALAILEDRIERQKDLDTDPQPVFDAIKEERAVDAQGSLF